MSHPVDRAQLDTVFALGTRGWKPSRFAGAAKMAASTRWRHASQSRIAGSGGILPPTGRVFLYTPVDSPRLHSHPAEDMDCYRVSKLANNARNDSPDCITAVQKPLFWTAVMRINYGLTPFGTDRSRFPSGICRWVKSPSLAQ